MNLYEFVRGNPLNWVDPFGLNVQGGFHLNPPLGPDVIGPIIQPPDGKDVTGLDNNVPQDQDLRGDNNLDPDQHSAVAPKNWTGG
jgi:hypothetical protein